MEFLNINFIREELSKFGVSLCSVKCFLMFFGFGVILGFLCKKWFRCLIVAVILGALIIKGLEYRGLLSIDWNLVHSTIGTTPAAPLQQWLGELYAIAMKDIYLTIVSACGFLIGYKAG